MNVATRTETLPERAPKIGELVQIRSRRWLVENVIAAGPGESPQVELACADDDAQGQSLTVFWDYELDRRILEDEGWSDLAAKGFDSPLDGPGAVLHAKAVVADDEAVFVTSANLTDAALDRNIELGIFLRDRALAASVTSHLRGLIDHELLKPLPAA